LPPSADELAGRNVAVAAEILFLANLLVAPGIAFLTLAWMYRRYVGAPALARCHVSQAFFASLWCGALLVLATAGILALGGLDSKWTWVIVILYFTCIHASFVLLGTLGLAKALAGRPYIYPLIGRRFE